MSQQSLCTTSVISLIKNELKHARILSETLIKCAEARIRKYVFLVFAMSFRVIASVIAPVGLNRLLHYLETGGSGAVVRPWVRVLWLFVGPWLSGALWESHIFTTTHSA